MAQRPYERKISSEESREGYILVEKSRLPAFPPLGQPFELLDGGNRTIAMIEARDCICRGPDKPHQHYFIRKTGLAKGSRVRLTPDGAGYRIVPA